MANTPFRNLDTYEGYDLWAPIYDFWKHPVRSMAARHGVRILSPQPGEVILDAGCGTGRDLAEITEAGATAVGIDFSEIMLGLAVQTAPEAQLHLVDLQDPLPFDDATFDGVLCSLVGEHIDNLPRLMREFLRVLKPAGRLVFIAAHPDFEGVVTTFRMEGIPYYIPTYNRSVQDYLDGVAAADFEDIAFRGFNADATLIETMPTAKVHLGKPVLLLIAATVGSSFRYVDSPDEAPPES